MRAHTKILSAALRLTAADTATAAGRSRGRYRRAVVSSIAVGGGRAIAILTVLISIPLALGYLGPERFGLWATISSLIAILSFADAGLGNGLVTAIASADGRDDREAARTYVSSAFFLLLGLALALGAAFILAFPHVPWASLYNVDSPLAVREAGVATAVFAACFLGSLPAAVVERVQAGYQEGYINGLWASFGSLVGLAGVLVGIFLEAGLPWLVLAMAGGPLAGLLVNGAFLFFRRRPWLRPRVGMVTKGAASHLFRLGALFFVLQFAAALAFSSDNLVVARLFGPEAVTEYSVTMRLFSIAPMLLVILFTPLWPAYGEALTRGDVDWVKTALRRSLLGAVAISGAAGVILVVFGADVIHAWVGGAVTPSLWLLLGFGVSTVLVAAGNSFAMFLNGTNRIGLQAASAAVMAPAALAGKVLLGGVFGLAGVVWGTVAAYTLFTAIPLAFVTSRLLARLAPAGAQSAPEQAATTA